MGVPFPVWVVVVIARLSHLRTHSSVFRHLTGLTVAAFDRLAAELVPVLERAHRDALDRPDWQRVVCGGSRRSTQVNRHGRGGHAARGRPIAGLVNRMLDG